MAAIEKRGDLVTVSKSFGDLVDGWTSLGDTAIDIGAQFGLSKILGEGDPDGHLNKQILLNLKIYLPRYAPSLRKLKEKALERAARKFVKDSPQGADLLKFCQVYNLLEAMPSTRIVNKGITFTQASRNYDWKGSLLEAYQGTIFGDINSRREFVIYVPGRKVEKNPTFSLTVRASEYRG